MRITNSFALLIMSLSIGFGLSSCAKKIGNPEARLTVLTSMERIGQDQQLFGEAQAAISAAKNEVESFQVVVGAVQKNVRVMQADISDLTGNAGTIKKDNIRLYREEYARVRRSSPRAQLPPGLYADPLVPFINPVTGKPIEPFNQHRKNGASLSFQVASKCMLCLSMSGKAKTNLSGWTFPFHGMPPPANIRDIHGYLW